MQQYLDLLQYVLDNGEKKGDRTGTGTISVFGHQVRFDLSKGFPALTTKRLYFHGVKIELLWFLRGDTNIKWLNEHNVSIWDEWANEEGDLGPVYGHQWRKWGEHYSVVGDPVSGIDQIAQVIQAIKENPNSRRHLVVAWNPTDVPKMALPPCHCLFQFHVVNGKLSCQLYQRSCDLFLGVPFNIASYALLTCMIAQVTGLEPGEFIHTFGDLHIYLNHLDQVQEQLSRTPHESPKLWLNPDIKNIDDFEPDDIRLDDYKSHRGIAAPIAVEAGYKSKISLVVAMGTNRVIGKDGGLPWHPPSDFPKDMVRFRRKTLGKVVIMGRKTHESIGMTLPERDNIVLTRQKNYEPFPGSKVAHSLEKALEMAKGYPEIVIVGGLEIYKQALEQDIVDCIYLTTTDHEPEGDVVFPQLEWINWSDHSEIWEVKKVLNFKADEKNKWDHDFIDIVRKNLKIPS